MAMKKIALLPILLAIQIHAVFAQELIFTAPGTKQGRLKISTSRVENNEFSMLLLVEWLDTKLAPTEEKNSFIVFNRNDVKVPGDGSIKCKTFAESNSDYFYFNNTLTLKFEVKDNIKIVDTKFNLEIPFRFAAGVNNALDQSKWVGFLSRSPRNFLAQITINPYDIKDLTPPKVTIISPEGVMDGFRPQVYDKEIEVKVMVTDINSISNVSINNAKAVQVNDSIFIGKVQFSRIGGTYPITVVANDRAGNVGQKEFFVETKQPDDVASKLYAEQKKEEMVSDVDTLIPQIKKVYENRYALIIGNEDYKSHQRGLNYESNVEFARRDAETFKQYAVNTLGIKESNVIFLLDAKAVEMHRGINQLNNLMKATRGNGEAIVFFAGHGFPDEKTKEGHLIPVDVSGNDLEFAIKLKDLYTKLNEHPSKGVTVFLDACFSGGGREQGLLAARAVRVKPRDESIKGNMVVLSASAGNESALPFRNKYHGMFTYYLLKALQDSEGNITMGELVDYVTNKVSTSSIIHNSKEQNPTLNVSLEISENWKEWRFNQ
jgi:hypothetical protein